MNWKIWIGTFLALAPAGMAWGQAGLTGVEPGLENAVRWKWRVLPSPAGSWGLELPEVAPVIGPTPSQPVEAQAVAGDTYEVKRGDALILIAKKTGRTVAQLKAANGLKDNMIRIGDVLRIPTLEECLALGLPPEPAAAAKKPAPGSPDPEVDRETLLLQVFLDRKNFSAGPIDGKSSPAFQKLVYLTQAQSGGASLVEEATAAVGDITIRYTLKPEDFRFIAPPKAERPVKDEPKAELKAKSKKSPAEPPKAVPPVYEEMVSAPMLAYRTPWEFVAERFHCSEGLLKTLNPGVQPQPLAGVEFVVPNVLPFEIENLPAQSPQPASDPAQVVTAAIVDLSRLEIYSNDQLVAMLPVAAARPGLRGRGTWKIMDAISRPCLATLREPRDPPKQADTFFTGETEKPKEEVLPAEEFLPAGPNNPAGILWIQLTKADSPEPLPYGLHGTGIPGKISSHASLGGFRMPNWDIARAARMLPLGTALHWRQGAAPGAAPAMPPSP